MAFNIGRHQRRTALAVLVSVAMIALSSRLALCQAGYISTSGTEPVVLMPGESMPAYEVATIKPADGNGFAPPLRGYIQGAFGISGNRTGWIVGPDWINNAKYVVQAKPPEAIQTAMQSMSPEKRTRTIHLMQQSLLAERFKLKAHFETREMTVYQLEPAKGGPKLKEAPETARATAQFAVGSSALRAKAATINVLTQMLESQPDIGGRAVIDNTGLTGIYDFSLKWTPMNATAPDSDAASLFTAIEEQLGLKLVSAKAPGQILVIDHIEQPSEN